MARASTDRTLATYNVIVTLDRGLAKKFTQNQSRGEFKTLLDTGARGVPNTAVFNNRDESFLSLDHRVAYGEGNDDKSLSVTLEVLEPELQFLRTFLDTALSKRLARLVERRNSLIKAATPSPTLTGSTYLIDTTTAGGGSAANPGIDVDPPLTEAGILKDFAADLPKLFPHVYIMYGIGEDLGHWAGPFESVLIDINYVNTMRGLEKTKYTFVSSPEATLFKKSPDKMDSGEQRQWTVRVPLFGYEREERATHLDPITGGTTYAWVDTGPHSDTFFSKGLPDPVSNNILDIDKILTELISHYLVAVGIPNHLVVLPDMNYMLAQYLENSKADIWDRLKKLAEREGLSDPTGLAARTVGLDLAKNIYEPLGLKIVAFEDSQAKGGPVFDAPVINQEEYLDLSTVNPYAGRYYVTFDIDAATETQIANGNHLAPIKDLLERVAKSTSVELIEPYWYWESNLELANAYRIMIGTSPRLISGGSYPVSTEAGIFVFGARKYIKNYLQAGIVVHDSAKDRRMQRKLLRATTTSLLDGVPAIGSNNPFWNRILQLNNPGSEEYEAFHDYLNPYKELGLPFFQYILSIANKKYKTTSFFDPDLDIDKVPDEFNYSKEAKEGIVSYGLPIFRCNTSNPNVLDLNIKTDEGFFALFNMSFSEMQWSLAQQVAAVPHKKIKMTNPTLTKADVLALLTKLLKDYSSSDPLWDTARALMLKGPIDPRALARNLETLLTTQSGLGMSKVHKKYTKSATMSFLYFFFKMFNFRFSGRIKTLPMFEYSDSSLLNRPSLLFVNRLNHVRQLYNGQANLNPTNSFYSGLYKIFGFRHFFSSKDAYSEFLLIKDPLQQAEEESARVPWHVAYMSLQSSLATAKFAARTMAEDPRLPEGSSPLGKASWDPWTPEFMAGIPGPNISEGQFSAPSPEEGSRPNALPPDKDTGGSRSVVDVEPPPFRAWGPPTSPPDEWAGPGADIDAPGTFEGSMTPILTLHLGAESDLVASWVEENTNWNIVKSDYNYVEIALDFINKFRSESIFSGKTTELNEYEEAALMNYWTSLGYTHPKPSPGMIQSY